MANLPVHKVAGVAEAIERIRTALQETKAHLRLSAERAIPCLLRRISRVVADFSAQECRNFFRRGYVQTRLESGLGAQVNNNVNPPLFARIFDL
jgi:hypothetical protein